MNPDEDYSATADWELTFEAIAYVTATLAKAAPLVQRDALVAFIAAWSTFNHELTALNARSCSPGYGPKDEALLRRRTSKAKAELRPFLDRHDFPPLDMRFVEDPRGPAIRMYLAGSDGNSITGALVIPS